MAVEARPEEIEAAQEIVRAAVVEARRLATERGLNDQMILGIAATRLEAFAFWATLTQAKPEEYFNGDVEIVRLRKHGNLS